MKKIILVVTILMLVLTGCGKKEKEVEKEDNKPIIYEDQNIDGLKIEDFNLDLEDNGMTNVVVSIENTENDDMYVKLVEVYLYDQSGKLIGDTYFYIDTTLKSGEEKIYQSEITSDVTSATKTEFKVIK